MIMSKIQITFLYSLDSRLVLHKRSYIHTLFHVVSQFQVSIIIYPKSQTPQPLDTIEQKQSLDELHSFPTPRRSIQMITSPPRVS